MWKHRSDLIKSGPNIFKICPMVDLPSENSDHDGIFSIDGYDPHILLYCIGSWWLNGGFGIVSMTAWIVKSSSSNKFKPIFFPEGCN